MKTRHWLVRAGAAVLVSIVAAEVLGRAAGWGALGPNPAAQGKVALTFDDGPSERTLELLEILQKHGVQATFFVTEPACRDFPKERLALRLSGQQVEAHGRWHKHALLLPPWREWEQIKWHPRASEQGPLLYRPPYGGHSPFTRLFARLLGRKIALWDVEGRDWTADGAADLAAQTLAKVQGGSVILLHDGPVLTPELLDRLLVGLRERGLTPVRLSELPMHPITLRQGLGRLWQSYGA